MTVQSETCSSTSQGMKKHTKITKTIILGVDLKNKKRKSTTFDANSIDEIEDLQGKLCEMEGIETNLQKVFFAVKSLENGHTLSCDKKDGSSICMSIHLGARMHIVIKASWTGNLVGLDVHSWNTVSDVKSMFQEKEGTPVNQLTLIYSGKQLDDCQTLASYDVKNDTTIYAFFLGDSTINISVKMPERRTIDVKVKLFSSVEKLKSMIDCMTGIPMYSQNLSFNGKFLKNREILAGYKIQMGSTLDLEILPPGRLSILVNTPNGRTLTFSMNTTSLASELVSNVQYQLGIPKKQMILSFKGTPLKGNSDNTLVDYGILEGDSTLELMILSLGCSATSASPSASSSDAASSSSSSSATSSSSSSSDASCRN